MAQHGTTALVTGATGKVGSAVSRELAAAGYDVALHATNAAGFLEELAQEIRTQGRGALAVGADLAAVDACDALVERVCDEFGGIDCFVHCASVFEATPLDTITAEQWDRLMAIDLRSAFFLSRAVGLRMKKESLSGNIVHFSDITRDRPYGNHLPYCMAKAAIDTMVKGLASALAPNVKVNAIAPYIAGREDKLSDDDMQMIAKLPLRRATDPREIGRLVRYLVTDNQTMTGQILAIDGGRGLMW